MSTRSRGACGTRRHAQTGFSGSSDSTCVGAPARCGRCDAESLSAAAFFLSQERSKSATSPAPLGLRRLMTKVPCGLHRKSKAKFAPHPRTCTRASSRPPRFRGMPCLQLLTASGPAASVPSRLPMPHSRATTTAHACSSGPGPARRAASESAKLREYDIGTERYLAPEMTKNEPCVSAHAE